MNLENWLYLYKAVVTNVVDGDTCDVIADEGFNNSTKKRIRFLRINTPERGKPGYAEAKAWFEKNYLGKAIYIKTVKKDSFGRWLAELYDPVDQFSINNKILELRLGVPYVKDK